MKLTEAKGIASLGFSIVVGLEEDEVGMKGISNFTFLSC